MAERPRICLGAAHYDGCHHQAYLRQGLMRWFANPKTRHQLAQIIANLEHPLRDPYATASTILTELARGADMLDEVEDATP